MIVSSRLMNTNDKLSGDPLLFVESTAFQDLIKVAIKDDNGVTAEVEVKSHDLLKAVQNAMNT